MTLAVNKVAEREEQARVGDQQPTPLLPLSVLTKVPAWPVSQVSRLPRRNRRVRVAEEG